MFVIVIFLMCGFCVLCFVVNKNGDKQTLCETYGCNYVYGFKGLS